MDNNESPVQETDGSPSSATDNAINPEDGILAIANEIIAGTPDEVSTDEPEGELEVSEESDIQVETPDSEGDEDDTPVEAQEESEEDEELTEEESADEDTSKLEMFDYDDIKDGLIPVKQGGEVVGMTISQIQSQLGQLGAASKKSREASEQLESIQTERSVLQEEQAAFKAQQQAVALTPELNEKAGRLQNLNNMYQSAAQAGDASKAVQIEAAIKKESEEFNTLQQQHSDAVEEARGQHIQAQVQILEQKGLGAILNDDGHSEKFSSYVESNLSESAQYAVNMDATLVEALEKARLYDESKKAVKKVSKKAAPRKKTLKAGDNKVTAAGQKAQAEAAQRERRRSGNLTEDEALAGLDAIAHSIVNG